jgi:hypothetical protein
MGVPVLKNGSDRYTSKEMQEYIDFNWYEDAGMQNKTWLISL